MRRLHTFGDMLSDISEEKDEADRSEEEYEDAVDLPEEENTVSRF